LDLGYTQPEPWLKQHIPLTHRVECCKQREEKCIYKVEILDDKWVVKANEGINLRYLIFHLTFRLRGKD
jgi:hypothetical protein